MGLDQNIYIHFPDDLILKYQTFVAESLEMSQR